MPRSTRPVVLLLAATGCAVPPAAALAPVVAEMMSQDEVATMPTEDGARYVMVSSDETTPAGTLRLRWKRLAHQACEGEYLVISESLAEAQRDGLTAQRTYEGFVRCALDPESGS